MPLSLVTRGRTASAVPGVLIWQWNPSKYVCQVVTYCVVPSTAYSSYLLLPCLAQARERRRITEEGPGGTITYGHEQQVMSTRRFRYQNGGETLRYNCVLRIAVADGRQFNTPTVLFLPAAMHISSLVSCPLSRLPYSQPSVLGCPWSPSRPHSSSGWTRTTLGS